jgi:hypothetical protein
MRRILLIIAILMIASLACSSLSGGASGGELSVDERAQALAKLPYPGFKAGDLGPYAATFEIRFQGSYTWSYLLRTFFDGEHIEYRLEYVGLKPADDIGAVRMVSDGETSRMIGPGTDNECFLFPSDYDTELSFFNPDDMLDPFLANEGLEVVGTDEIEEFQAEHYSAYNESLDKWEDVQVDIWLNPSNQNTLLYEMGAAGSDPLFDAGEGHISINYLVKEIADQTIEPITDCTIPVPLPENATRVASFPGRVSFESSSSMQEIVAFYQTALPREGWQESNPPEESDGAFLMSYKRGEGLMQINIEIRSRGVEVEILIHTP